MKVPIIKPDLPNFERIKERFEEVLSSGKVTNFGKYVTEFENLAEEYLGTHAISVSSGTMALVFTLQALGLKSGGKVILPSFTFMATAQAILYAGGVPLFAEVGDDLTLSPADLEKLLKQHRDIAVVLPVHTFGLPCRVKEIQQVVDNASKKYSRPIALVYDAAHAFGASRDGIRVGNFGIAEIFSLSVTKALTTIEGGLVSSKDLQLINQIRKMRNYGMESYTYNATLPGLNGKMSEFHAIIGIENLKRIETVMEERRKKADYFLREIKEKTPFQPLVPPAHTRHTFKDFTILVPKQWKEERNRIMEFLKEKGIETRAYFYPPVHEQEFFKRFQNHPLARTEDLSRRVVTLPFFTGISQEEMAYIVDSLVQAVRIRV